MATLVLDTETTGLNPVFDKIIEIAVLEIIAANKFEIVFHTYLDPNMKISAAASNIHGIRNSDLIGKPKFKDIADELLKLVNGAELVIHNAPFDVGFINEELKSANYNVKIEDSCKIIDTLAMAKTMYPKQRNSLDMLCKRLNIDYSHRELHGAKIDVDLLAKVYVIFNTKQKLLFEELADDKLLDDSNIVQVEEFKEQILSEEIIVTQQSTKTITKEYNEHQKMLNIIKGKSNNRKCLWEEYENL